MVRVNRARVHPIGTIDSCFMNCIIKGSITRTVSITVFATGTFDLFNVTYK